MTLVTTMKRFLLASAVFIAAAGYAQKSDSTYSFTLQEAQDFALKNNKEVINAKLDIKSAKAKIKETTAIGLPQVEATATFTHIFEVPVLDFSANLPEEMASFAGEPTPLMEENSLTYEIMATQLLFSGEYIVGLQASQTYKEFSEVSAEIVEINTRETVANSYFAVLIADENLAILDSNILAVQSMSGEMQKMVDVGLADQNDADQLKLNLANLKTAYLQVELQAQIARRLLKYNLGLPMEADIQLSDDFNLLFKPKEVENIDLVFNPENHIQYQMLEVNEKLMKLSMQREKTTLLPTLAAFAKYKGYADEPEMLMEPKSMVGLTLTVPIFGSGMKIFKIKQAKIDYLKSQNSKEFATQGLWLAAEQAENDLTVAVKQYNTQKESMMLAERIFKQTMKKQKRGMASSFELTTAQNQFLTAQREYFQAMFTVLSKKIALDKAYGNL